METAHQPKSRKSRLCCTRPSILDTYYRGDTYIAPCKHHGLLVLYLNNQPIHLIPGTALENSALNQMLFSIRARMPRQYVRRTKI